MSKNSEIQPEEILNFWLGELGDPFAFPQDKNKLWFIKSEETDKTIKTRFGLALEHAQAGGFTAWETDPRHRLALIILLDQFSRNVFRGEARAFAADHRALKLTEGGLSAGMDRQLSLIERVFFYLPLEHDESLASQDRCVALYQNLCAEAQGPIKEKVGGFLDYAVRHREVIVRFGRYPHRNAILGRPSTPEEETYLAQPGAGF